MSRFGCAWACEMHFRIDGFANMNVLMAAFQDWTQAASDEFVNSFASGPRQVFR